ncbi:MAG: NnrU family protein [Pseudomonadota bacterium]
MIFLVCGVLLWWAAHLFKRLAPGPRAAMSEHLGDASKGIFALLILTSVVLVVLGYRMAEFVPVYTPPGWAVHLNNLLMLFAIALFGAGSSKGRARSLFRHPMLLGFATWAVAHLLVNGDLASLVLFGGLLLWVPVAIWRINSMEPAWQRPAPGPPSGDLRLLVITLIIYAAVAAIHTWLGRWPFAGG